jgi:hypothetical protein
MIESDLMIKRVKAVILLISSLVAGGWHDMSLQESLI